MIQKKYAQLSILYIVALFSALPVVLSAETAVNKTTEATSISIDRAKKKRAHHARNEISFGPGPGRPKITLRRGRRGIPEECINFGPGPGRCDCRHRLHLVLKHR